MPFRDGENSSEFMDKANDHIGNRIRSMNGNQVYNGKKKALKEKNGKKEKVCMTKKEFNKEHKNLVKVLKKGNHEDQEKEAKSQEKEMKEYKNKKTKESGTLTAVKAVVKDSRKKG